MTGKKRWLLFFLLLYFLYSILMSSHIVGDKRYFLLFDDAMISMTYAKSLVKGCGLVWYCGADKVEGITNLGWTLYMALWHLLPIPPEKLSLPIQITGAFALIGIFCVVYRISKEVWGNEGVAFLSGVLSLMYFPLMYWSLMGMEVGVLTLFILLLVYSRIKGRWEYLSPLLVILGILTRQDFFILVLGLVMVDFLMKRYRLGFLTLLVSFLTLGGITLFRLLYYGDILPNTYYLKVWGFPLWVRVGKGLITITSFSFYFPTYALLFLSFFLTVRRLKNRRLLYAFLPFILYILYDIYVGGDAWEGHLGNRFIATVGPIAVAVGLGGIGGLRRRFLLLFLSPLAFPITEVIYACINPKKGIYIELLKESLKRYHYLLNIRNEYHVSVHRAKICQALHIRDYVPDGTNVGVVWAGIVPYFAYGKRFVDMLGKNNAKIAHMRVDVKKPWKFYPGHNKYDYPYVLGSLKPDVITKVFSVRTGEERAVRDSLLNEYYEKCKLTCGDIRTSVFIRKDSNLPIRKVCKPGVQVL